jgi:hypothetical protein
MAAQLIADAILVCRALLKTFYVANLTYHTLKDISLLDSLRPLIARCVAASHVLAWRFSLRNGSSLREFPVVCSAAATARGDGKTQ